MDGLDRVVDGMDEEREDGLVDGRGASGLGQPAVLVH